jgi:hypothetical protein
MDFRRSGSHNDRRRRIVNDAVLGDNSAVEKRAKPRERLGEGFTVRRTGNYGDAEFLDEQPRLIDLVPTRLLSFFLIFLCGAALVAAVEILYYWATCSPSLIPAGQIAALDLGGPNSLAVWFRATLAELAGILALVVYSVRRFKVDDYRGHYRVWCWTAIGCWMMSLDQTAHLRHAFRDLMVASTGVRFSNDGSEWWLVPCVFLLGSIGFRLAADMRPCRLAMAALAAMAVSYLTAAAVSFHRVAIEDQIRKTMIEQGALLFGNLFLPLSIGLYTRHVLLDARGLLPERRQKPAVQEQAVGDPTAEEDTREGPTSEQGGRTVSVYPTCIAPSASSVVNIPPPAQARPASNKPILTVGPAADPKPAPAAVTEDRKLTKAERRRLKEQRKHSPPSSQPKAA